MSVRLPLVLALALFASPALAAPSFDCAKAKKPVEKAICADAALSALDADIAAAYGRATARVSIDAGAAARLRELQRTFVAERNAAFVKPGYRMEEHLAAQKALLENWPANAHALAGGDIAQWLKGLPKEVLEATSDGIESDADMAKLVASGETEVFRLRRIDARHAIITNKHNTDRVELVVTDLPEPLLMAHTRNQQVSTFTYWMPAGPTDGALVRHNPSVAIEAISQSDYRFDTDKGGARTGVDLLARMSPELRKYLSAREECQHWGGEVSDDLPAERRKQIEQAVARLRCNDLPATEAKLRKAAAGDAPILAVLDRLKEAFGD